MGVFGIFRSKKNGGRMKNLAVSVFRDRINALMDEIFFHNERYIIMKNGKKRAVIMSYDDFLKIEQYIRSADEARVVR